jgi:hypothetical protein
MDEPTQFENNETEKNAGEGRVEDLSATKVVSSIPEDDPSVPKVVEPPKPISTTAQPLTFSSVATPPKDNRTSIVAIIAVAVVALSKKSKVP